MKPKVKSKVAILNMLEGTGDITLYATEEDMVNFAEFGHVEKWSVPNKYTISIDARYTFREVVTYIENYG